MGSIYREHIKTSVGFHYHIQDAGQVVNVFRITVEFGVRVSDKQSRRLDACVAASRKMAEAPLFLVSGL